MPACMTVATRALGPGAAAPRAASDARSCHSGSASSCTEERWLEAATAAARPTERVAAAVGSAYGDTALAASMRLMTCSRICEMVSSDLGKMLLSAKTAPSANDEANSFSWVLTMPDGRTLT
eukprot:974966-Pleurochrysis_carterae.AAC.2